MPTVVKGKCHYQKNPSEFECEPIAKLFSFFRGIPTTMERKKGKEREKEREREREKERERASEKLVGWNEKVGQE